MKKSILIFLILTFFLLLVSGCTPPQPPMPSNRPPNAPSNPNPPNGAQGVVINPELSWECSDPDGDVLVYDIYLGINPNNLGKIKENHNDKSYQLIDLAFNTTYYWKIVAKDGKGGVTEGPVWSFTTQSQGQINNPPNAPSNPNPPNGAQGVVINPELSWECSDPDGDVLVYDIYFGVNPNNLENIKKNHSYSSYQLSDLQYNTTYYWKIVAKDGKGGVTEGPVWSFTTQTEDVAKAKALIADLRNTVLTIHDYKGIGVPGIVDTPFQRLSEEIQEKIVPDLTETVERIGFIVNCTLQITLPGTYYFTYTEKDYLLKITYTSPTGPNTNLTLNFLGLKSNIKIDEGSLIIHYDINNKPTSGSLNATMKTKDGNLVITGEYTATTLQNASFFDTITITGNISSPYVTIDFSEGENKLYANFGEYEERIYLEEIQVKGKITTTTAQAEGDLDVDATYVIYPNGNTYNPPEKVQFTGTFREMLNGQPTGAYFTGTISAQYFNPTEYKFYEPYGPQNFPKWKASFNGHIEAPNRPKIDANLELTHDEYQLYKIKAGYERTNPNGSKVWLKTSTTPQSYYNEGIKLMEVWMNNQDGLILYFKVDGTKTGDEVFSGDIRNNAGMKLADLYLLNGIPMVKYLDNYIESIF